MTERKPQKSRSNLRPTTLGELFAPPRTLTVNGVPWTVAEFRVKDVARLEWLLADCEPSGGSEGDNRAALDAALDWPPAYGTDAFSAAIGTGWGAVAFLWLALSREDPRLSIADAAEIATRVTPDEWSALYDTCWGRKPWERIADAMNPRRHDHARALAQANGGANPGRSVEIVRKAGLTYGQVGEMTLTQFENAISEGEAKGINASGGTGAVARSWADAIRQGLVKPPKREGDATASEAPASATSGAEPAPPPEEDRRPPSPEP